MELIGYKEKRCIERESINMVRQTLEYLESFLRSRTEQDFMNIYKYKKNGQN